MRVTGYEQRGRDVIRKAKHNAAKRIAAKKRVAAKKTARPMDPDFVDVLKIIQDVPARVLAQSGIVGRATIYNWRKRKVSRPLHYTMQAALQAVGKEFRICEIKKN